MYTLETQISHFLNFSKVKIVKKYPNSDYTETAVEFGNYLNSHDAETTFLESITFKAVFNALETIRKKEIADLEKARVKAIKKLGKDCGFNIDPANWQFILGLIAEGLTPSEARERVYEKAELDRQAWQIKRQQILSEINEG
jgi:hypothetical protein